MSMLSILLCLSLVYGLVRVGSTNLEVGSPCSPPSKDNINCGESQFVNETVSELSVADGYGYVVSYDYTGGHHFNFLIDFAVCIIIAVANT